ncbi:MAG: putative transcriptional regulator [uncultured bacterium]|nr:MAG: putative transcriptional regulator [uncultured bacterium]
MRLFFSESEKAFFVRELSRNIGVQINAVRRELEILLSMDIIKEKESKELSQENELEVGEKLRKYYILNPESIIYSELQALLVKDKIIGQKEFIKAFQTKMSDVRLLILSGEFTADKRAPTDLLVVGKIKPRVLAKIIEDYEKEFGFNIRYTVMAEEEFADRRYVMDKFLYALFEADHLKVINDLGI